MVPTGIVDTLWFEVEAQCREWGDEFDAWQDGLGQLTLGLREDGLFAASIGGVTFSIPRQVAKTFIVMRIVFAICALFPNTTVLWTAHRTRTATQTFEKLKAYAKRPAVKAHLAKTRNDGMRDSHGEQEIRFANGSVIMFGAREQGFGRGFDEVDIEVFDEAQILTEKALEDMVAATNQSRFPHGALLFYMGTPPRPTDPGEEFTRRRQKALSVKPNDVVYAEHGDAMYVECSADPDVGKPGGPSLDDIEQVAIANPSYPHRTPPVSVARLRENLTSDDSWRREGLGVWDDFARTSSVIPLAQWSTLEVETPPDNNAPPNALGLDRWYDSATAVVGCWGSDEAWRHVEVVAADVIVDTRAVVDWVAERAGRTIPVLMAADSPAAALEPDLTARGVDVRLVTRNDYAKACGGFHDDVVEGRLTHAGQEHLTDALRGAKKKDIGQGGAWGWDRKDPSHDISPLVAATLARHGAVSAQSKKPSPAFAF